MRRLAPLFLLALPLLVGCPASVYDDDPPGQPPGTSDPDALAIVDIEPPSAFDEILVNGQPAACADGWCQVSVSSAGDYDVQANCPPSHLYRDKIAYVSSDGSVEYPDADDAVRWDDWGDGGQNINGTYHNDDLGNREVVTVVLNDGRIGVSGLLVNGLLLLDNEFRLETDGQTVSGWVSEDGSTIHLERFVEEGSTMNFVLDLFRVD